MAGYIGSKASVTQVDGYNRDEADAEFVQVAGDTMTGDLSVTGTVTAGTVATSYVNISPSSGYGNIEMGGPSGAYIDFKAPFSDDYDGRIIYDSASSHLVITTQSANEPVVLAHGYATKLNTTAAGVDITGALGVNANGAGGITALHLNKNDATGYFIRAEYDGTLAPNRTYTLKPPSSDSSTEPFTWSTGNSHS